ncbi:hypothetical protein HK096_004537 [Nowakowskiella sp. JEL0078]|nr:hypothetical protein HK096_004537 [Nowakowskiella sp. JEL0078]
MALLELNGAKSRKWDSTKSIWVHHLTVRPPLLKALSDAFLPADFPHSVTPDYVPYQLFDSAQAFCSTITGMLATRATFKAAGVGDVTATATSAALTWILRDGVSMIGRILFAWGFSSQLDNDAKTWRLTHIFNDLSIGLEILSQFSPSFLFIWLACISTILRALCGVAGGATKAALSQHFAKQNNMADLNAKDGSQETIVNLCGMFLAAFVLRIVPESSSTWTWSAFLFFTFLHLASNWRAVKSVVLKTVNTQRADILSRVFLTAKGKIMSPIQVSKVERIFWNNHSTNIEIGVPMSIIMSSISGDEAKSLTEKLSHEKDKSYVLFITRRSPSSKPLVMISIKQDAGSTDVLCAYFHAVQLQITLNSPDFQKCQTYLGSPKSNPVFTEFLEGLKKAGWELDVSERSRLTVKEWTFRIDSD